MGGKSSGSSASPDPAIGQAALENVQLGKDWLAYATQATADQNTRQDAQDALNNQVINQQLETSKQAQQWATEDRDRYDQVFKPLQDQMIDQANAYAAPEKQDEAAAEAKADTTTAIANQAAANSRQMTSMGINPDSGRSESLARSNNLAGALGIAGAENTARQSTRDKALSLESQVSGLGNGLSSQATSNASLGLTAGNSASQLGQQGLTSSLANNGIMTSGYQGAISGNNSGASILNSLYGNQLSAQNSANSASAGLGQAIGGIAMTGLAAF